MAVTARRFKSYQSYKDSGVERLGEIPAGWEVKPLKRGLRPGGADGSLIKGRMHQEPGEGLFPGFSASGQDIWVEEAQHHQSGIVLSAVGARCGKTFKADGKWTAVANTHVIFPRAGHDRDFLWYLTNDEFFWDRGGTAQPFVRVASTLQRPWCFPSFPEQRAIAAFLDRETTRIDALVTKKERLIELLQEKRTARITRAATKGLDPNVPMKDSGVEWLGEIPAHWEVKRIKFIAQVGNGSTPNRDNPEYWGGEYPWLNSSVVNLHEVTEGSDFVTGLALAECHLPRVLPPAVLVGITGEGRTRGMATVLRAEATINQHLAFIRPTCGHADVEYLRYVFHSAYQFLRDESGGGGSTKGALTCEQLENLPIAFPPEAEQRAITGVLNQETARIDALIAKVHEAIDRLQELRMSLISAAVTGKIDVREEVA